MVMQKSDDILICAAVPLHLNPNSKELASIALESARFSSKILNKKITQLYFHILLMEAALVNR